MCVCTYLRICTQSLHVTVYVFAQMHTEFSCGCIREYVSEEFTWVCVYI